jgi:uncharacterized coiled-coil protein SlyX
MSVDDYIIIQNETRTSRIQIKDLILSKDNVTFGQEINDIYKRVSELTTVISAQQSTINELQSTINELQTVNKSLIAQIAEIKAR